MANKNSKVTTKKVSKVIAWLLLVLLLIGLIAVIWRFTNGGNEDFKTFYLTYGGEDILTADSSMVLPCDEEHRFDVKYTFDLPSSEPRGYNVKIVANAEADFEFTVDGKLNSWRGEEDITAAFNLRLESKYFMLSVPDDTSVATYLHKLYSGKDIEAPLFRELKNRYIFTLVVSSYNDGVTYEIDFTPFVVVDGVTMDSANLVL